MFKYQCSLLFNLASVDSCYRLSTASVVICCKQTAMVRTCCSQSSCILLMTPKVKLNTRPPASFHTALFLFYVLSLYTTFMYKAVWITRICQCHNLHKTLTKTLHTLTFEHTPNFNALNLLTCCFNFWFLLNILCKYQTILSKQVSVVN